MRKLVKKTLKDFPKTQAQHLPKTQDFGNFIYLEKMAKKPAVIFSHTKKYHVLQLVLYLYLLVFPELSIIAVCNVTDWFQGWASSDAVHLESELGSNSNDKLCVEVRQSFRGHIQRHNSTLRVKRSLEAKRRPLFWATYPCHLSRPDRWFACEKVPAGKQRKLQFEIFSPRKHFFCIDVGHFVFGVRFSKG